MRSPLSLGYRMPAEWHPHRATWISWPHNRDTWPGKFETVEPVMVQAVAALAADEPVWINVLDAAHEAHVRGLLSGIEGDIRFWHVPTNDAWCRDHGPTFVVGPDGLGAVDFRYNAWGGKYPPFDLDQAAGALMAGHAGAIHFPSEMTLEGGALEVNGEGCLLTTASCVLNSNRNPGLSREDAEMQLRELLGVDTFIWVDADLAGDDTDGHIDNLVRFVTPNDVVTVSCTNPDDAHFEPLRAHVTRLRAACDVLGIRVHLLPLPRAVHFDGQRLPASYANFYIGNRTVLLPAYGGDADAEAAAILQRFSQRGTW